MEMHLILKSKETERKKKNLNKRLLKINEEKYARKKPFSPRY
jgi:hypothetical protein